MASLDLRSIHLQGDRADGVPEPSLPRFGVLAVAVDEESRLYQTYKMTVDFELFNLKSIDYLKNH